MRHIFAHVASAPAREWKVSMSYLEIYNEQLKDLLNPSAKVDVVEGLNGVDVRGCKPVEVTEASALRLLLDGDARRATAETAMNAASSRSHAVVRFTVESKKANGALILLCSYAFASFSAVSRASCRVPQPAWRAAAWWRRSAWWTWRAARRPRRRA